MRIRQIPVHRTGKFELCGESGEAYTAGWCYGRNIGVYGFGAYFTAIFWGQKIVED